MPELTAPDSSWTKLEQYAISVSTVCTSVSVLNQFVATAVAEMLSALQTAEFFADRKARADFKTFDKLMKRRGGKPSRAGDELRGSKSKAARHGRDNDSGAICNPQSTLEWETEESVSG